MIKLNNSTDYHSPKPYIWYFFLSVMVIVVCLFELSLNLFITVLFHINYFTLPLSDLTTYISLTSTINYLPSLNLVNNKFLFSKLYDIDSISFLLNLLYIIIGPRHAPNANGVNINILVSFYLSYWYFW